MEQCAACLGTLPCKPATTREQKTGNVLRLCPNDHMRFDTGAIYAGDTFDVDSATRDSLGQLRVPQATALM